MNLSNIPLIKSFISKSSFILAGTGPSFPAAAYNDLSRILNDKDYFIITTSTDNQFKNNAFSPERIYAPLGNCPQFHKDAHNRMRRQITAQNDKNILLLELELDNNHPEIIRYPFELLLLQRRNTNLIRINPNPAHITLANNHPNSIIIKSDAAKVLNALAESM